MSSASGPVKADLKESILKFVRSVQDRKTVKTLIFSHRQADPDALCSASALAALLEKWLPKGSVHITIVAPQGASQLSSRLTKKLGIEFIENVPESDIEQADLIFAVDLGDIALLDPYDKLVARSAARKILIDHHGQFQKSLPMFDLEIIDEEATSTCEIIASGVPAGDITKNTAQVLLVGIMFDSQHLGIARAATLEAALVLVRNGAQIDLSKEALRSKPERSEVIARLKSAQRIQMKEFGKYLLAFSEVSSFQASVARMIVEIGADIGMAVGEADDEVRLSLRCNTLFSRDTGLNLGSILERIAKEKEIVGGGHSTAASISGRISKDKLVEAVLRQIQSALPET